MLKNEFAEKPLILMVMPTDYFSSLVFLSF